MSKRFSLKMVATLVGTGIVSSLLTLPVLARANEQIRANSHENVELVGASNSLYAQLNPTTDSDSNNMERLIGITALGAGTAGVAWYLTRDRQPVLVNSLTSTNVSLIDRVSPRLRQKLLRLVHNEQTANRLLVGVMMSHGDRPADWLAEKAIYDLERDRG